MMDATPIAMEALAYKAWHAALKSYEKPSYYSDFKAWFDDNVQIKPYEEAVK